MLQLPGNRIKIREYATCPNSILILTHRILYEIPIHLYIYQKLRLHHLELHLQKLLPFLGCICRMISYYLHINLYKSYHFDQLLSSKCLYNQSKMIKRDNTMASLAHHQLAGTCLRRIWHLAPPKPNHNSHTPPHSKTKTSFNRSFTILTRPLFPNHI